MTLLTGVGFVALAALGALTRAAASRFDRAVPVGTITVNTAASFVAGFVAGSSDTTVVLVAVAFCGSLSTFSALVGHLHDQLRSERRRDLAATLGASVVLGVSAALTGLEIAGV